MDLRVTKLTSPSTASSPMKFAFGHGTGSVSGLTSLIQMVLIHLLTDPGSRALSPESGGGLQQSIDDLGAGASEAELSTVVQACVSKTKREIISDQAQHRLPSSERLSDLRVERVSSKGQGVVELRIRVINEAGQSQELAL